MPKNLKRVAAGKRNRALRGPLSDDGRRRLREGVKRRKPWLHSTGPRTSAGRGQSVKNGKCCQLGPWSVREIRAKLGAVRQLIGRMQAQRRSLGAAM
jgi:hypothetical protein